MLHEFVHVNRGTIIARTRARVVARRSRRPGETDSTNGIPVFLDQLADALLLATTSDVADHEQLSISAGQHGHDLLRMGLTIGQVVHDYGDVCQTITELAVEQHISISTEDFRTLNLCLDDAIAGAVTAYSHFREQNIADQESERLGMFAHELRNHLTTAMLSFEMIKSGRVAVGGSTAAVHGRSLLGLRDLIDRSLAHVRLDAGIGGRALISVAELVDELAIGAALHAQQRSIQCLIGPVDRSLAVEGDRQIIAAAISNLLHNAFKFTHPQGTVSLTTRGTADRVLFEIADECGGLPPGSPGDMFLPFKQFDADRSGLGLGLSIALKAAHASGGELHVRDLPGKGCIFTLDLPRKPPAPLSVVGSGTAAGGAPQAASGDVPARTSRTAPKARGV